LHSPSDIDSIAQARTGTGKTLGFLVPVLNNIIMKNPELGDRSSLSRSPRASDIRGIILSPTRELAEQISVEAKKLAKYTNIMVHTAVGGNSKGYMLQNMRRNGCHLLVATPGRLLDILSDPHSGVAAPDLTTFVLDEADRLLDIGFSAEIERIVDLLPDPEVVDRQTMMFSATISRDVLGLARRSLKPDFQFVQTVSEGDQPTHEKVPQKIVELSGLENMMPALLELCKREIKRQAQSGSDFKAIVYFASTANVKLAAEIFLNLLGPSDSGARHPLSPARIYEMHGRLTQQQRTLVSGRFRSAKSAILFSSDVTARGMDFPHVTHVIQVGLPPSGEQYVHRIGRTGRGDESGEGWLLIPDFEVREARRMLRGLPIHLDTSLEAASVDMTREAQLPESVANILNQVGEATKIVDRKTKFNAYTAYMAIARRCDKHEMVDRLNRWTRFGWGWTSPPSLPPILVNKLALQDVKGIVVGSENTLRGFSDRGSNDGHRNGWASNRGADWSSSNRRGSGQGNYGRGSDNSGRQRREGVRWGQNSHGRGYGGRERTNFRSNDRGKAATEEFGW
jgi:ATP-dependent RNA helicase MSS116